ncbi:MAG: fructose-bisphosphatase class III, partial [Lachnospiraceae bacterium]|nr:fructose-bisphosphatase class III [Lachnospiraceae bacterium]
MIYVLSDIHGNLRRFNSILEQIHLQPEDTLYILGDVIDRHPYGIQILCRIMEMPNVKMLLGNHEDMMMRALGSPYDTDELVNDSIIAEALRHWYHDEGQVTHEYWKRLDKEQQRAILDYLHSLPLNIDVTV